MRAEKKVGVEDLEKLRADLRAEIKAELVGRVDGLWGEQIVQKIVDRGAERVGHQQRVAEEAVNRAAEAGQRARLFEERLVRLKKEIEELSTAHHEKQAAFEKLSAEYDGLLPQVAELRREQQSHIARVRALEKEAS